MFLFRWYKNYIPSKKHIGKQIKHRLCHGVSRAKTQPSETNNQFEPWYAQAQTAKFSSGPCHTEFIIKIRGIHIIKSRNNALFVNNSPSRGAYTCACTESRSVLFEYLKLLCSSHVSVKLCGILSNVHTICFHFFPNFYIVKSTISFLFIDWPS